LKALMTLVALLSTPIFLEAQPKAELPCKLTEYRLVDRNTLVMRCDGAVIDTLTAAGELYKVADESIVRPAVQDDSMVTIPKKFFVQVSFKESLQPDQNYEVRFSGAFPTARADGTIAMQNFSARFRFSTLTDLTPVTIPGRTAQELAGVSAVTFLAEATLSDDSNHKRYGLSAPTPDPNDYDAMGRILLQPETSMLGKQLEAGGITDVFDRKFVVRKPKPAPPIAAPKNKDVASWYANFLHQAGPGVKPTWIADIKVAPIIGGMPAGLYFAPSLTIDVGQGAVGQKKTNDLINPKFAVTNLARFYAGPLQAVRFAPGIGYETNRLQDKSNILFDGDTRLYFSNLQNTKAERTLDAFLAARQKNPNILPQEVPTARTGYSIRFFFGTETGRPLTNNTVKSTDKSSQVVVPKYDIRRLRPRLSTTLEFWNFTVDVSMYPRYLLTAENVTREYDVPQPNGTIKKSIVVQRVSGWHPYGEAALTYALDPAGHYAFTTAYKLGAQPPNFDRISVMQSGILVRY
jgi:hypothetical protein